MALNPFEQVKDYETMLNRIMISSMFWSMLAIYWLRYRLSPLSDILSQIDEKIAFDAIKDVKLAGSLLPAIAIGGIFRIMKLHDRISSVFRIRQRFDVNHILRPLAEGAGIPPANICLYKLAEFRSDLMRSTFYKYASSTDPQIDKHLIYQALDWWSWYWIAIELEVILAGCAIAFTTWGDSHAWWAITGIFVTLATLPFFHSHCKRYASEEVKEILSDTRRSSDIFKAFNAI